MASGIHRRYLLESAREQPSSPAACIRDDDAVLDVPRLAPLLMEGGRQEQRIEPAREGPAVAVLEERSASKDGDDDLVAEPEEVARRVEAPRAAHGAS